MKSIPPLVYASVFLVACGGSPTEEEPSLYVCPSEGFDIKKIDKPAKVKTVICNMTHFINGDLSELTILENLEDLTLSDDITLERRLALSINSGWFPKLQSLALDNVLIDTLSYSSTNQIKYLRLNNVVINYFDVSALNNLETLDITFTNITNLDLSLNTEIKDLTIGWTEIEYFDLSNNSKLIKLSLIENKTVQPNFELTNHPELKTVTYRNQSLEKLTIHLPKLETIWLDKNKLSKVDFSHSPELSQLSLSDNLISHINLDANLKLNRVFLTENPLTDETKRYLKTLNWIKELKY
ncbi:leucine-rich repeat domain-containing protein [Pseudoalteromonas phenolica]|nr:hypothetical protein [Pseudoalteromonas phenolica]MBE0357070.1 hypothetical protein [Pseudoalteromonas phenolica O-BC30]TMO57948.1 hypothetical protein CWC21_01450 [Pseudoalteromonas phenolica]